MGEHCEYRVDIHDDPFKPSHPIRYRDVGFVSLLEVILIAFAVIVAPVAIFVVHLNGQTRESAKHMKGSDTSLSHNNDNLENSIGTKMEKVGGESPTGFSAVELL